MILVHHLRIGRSVFTVWLLEELGLEYELKFYDRNEMGRAPPELKDAHPLGKSPVIQIDGQTLAESGAIAAYLTDFYDPNNTLAPAHSDKAERLNWLQWLHYSEGSAFAPMLMKMLLMREAEMGGTPSPLLSMFSESEVALQLGYMQDSLGDKPFILGDKLQAPDIGFTYIAAMADRLGMLGDYPKLKAYADRNMARPAFQTAAQKTGG
ncbi:MAG: glutathione S-transferase family protein [Hyphomonadaceae bacterium]